MTDKELSAVLNANPAWMDGRGLFPLFTPKGFDPTDGARITHVASDPVSTRRRNDDGSPSQPSTPAPNCGGHDDVNRTLTISGVTIGGGAPDPNGVFVLPSNFAPSPSGCSWEYDLNPDFIFSVVYSIGLEPNPFTIFVQARTLGNSWDGQQAFTVAGGTAFATSTPNDIACPIGTNFWCGGVGTVS